MLVDDERPLRARFVSLDDEPSPPIGVVVYEAKDPGKAIDVAIAAGLPAPYGAVLWDSAAALARRFHRSAWQGRRVLELGCGCGLAGIVTAIGGATVLCTDVDPHTLHATMRGARDAGVTVDTALFDLTSHEPLPQVAGHAATDVVLSDVLYEELLAAAAARRALEALSMGARVFVGDPCRQGRHAFIRLLKDAGVSATFDDCVCVLTPLRPAPAGRPST